MLLLLLMYISPFVAVALFWRAQSVAAGIAPGDGAGEATGSVWTVIRSTVEDRFPQAKPAVAGFLAVSIVVAAATGAVGAMLFLAGVLFAAFSAALSHAASTVFVASARAASVASPRRAWIDASALSVALASLAAGSVGTLAWFFADPSGAVLLVTFLAGASAGSLFLALGTKKNDGGIAASLLLGEATAASAASAMHMLLPAAAAVLMIAATAEPELLRGLGAATAEPETLRSELLLLPVAITFLAPIVAVLVVPFAGVLLPRRGQAGFFDLERVAALVSAAVVVVLVLVCGLSWSVAAAFAAGLAARQLALVADEAAHRAARADNARSIPTLLPVLLAGAALYFGDRFAGVYGIALAALGMAATFAASSSASCARAVSAFSASPSTRPASLEAGEADAATNVAAILALLAALSPVLLSEAVRRGEVLPLFATAAPAVLGAVLVGAAIAANLSARYADPTDEAGAVRVASRAVVVAAALPVAVGMMFGASAAVGVALGFAGWAATSLPLANGEDSSPGPACLRRSVMLAWARTMALAALVGAPLMH